ncbi:UNVERIFIED_CONTAM: hypothetical protein PYX00_011802 [Menopon gallinae]|uniref:Small ribosomal subunit protein eS25 n=1 Tax=Menopon gallinae TaxID=328185 RepID=A0AAW2H8K6_9NEOP
MVKKVQESKEKKAAKIASTSSKEKKKWTQGKTREAVRRAVTVDAEMFAKVERDVAKASLVTAPAVAEKFGLNVGVAQRVLEHLCAGGVLRLNRLGRLVTSATKAFLGKAPEGMREERYSELCDAIRSGSHVRALEAYAEMIHEAVQDIVGADVPDDPECMLESISAQRDVLSKAEALFDVLKKEDFGAESPESRLDELCGALRRHDALVEEMREKAGVR